MVETVLGGQKRIVDAFCDIVEERPWQAERDGEGGAIVEEAVAALGEEGLVVPMAVRQVIHSANAFA
jgi:hypothetical protein